MSPRRPAFGAALVAAGVVLVVIGANAWVADDAYVGFRTLDNLLNGYGLRWNVDERVQVYTHPLWLLLHVPFYALSGEVFYTTIALSCALSVAAFLVGSRLLWAQPAWLLWAAAFPLLLSHAFVDYATSGLGSPLGFLLLALFAVHFLEEREPSILALSLLAALAAVNRPDTLLFYAPALAYVLVRQGPPALRRALLGFTPLILWELFSLLYYGFLLPNTHYARLPSNAALDWRLASGASYGVNLIQQDPISAGLLVAALAVGAGSAVAWATGRQERRPPARAALLGMGLLACCIHVVVIGGDLMQGRLFATPVFAATLILWSAVPDEHYRVPERWVAAGLAVMALVGVRLLALEAPWSDYRSGARDERALYAATHAFGGSGPAEHALAVEGLTARSRAAGLASGERDVVTADTVGRLGYYAGPDVVIVDPTGQTDPLLARLPASGPGRPETDYPPRELPAGYLDARRTGSLDGMDPDLRRYYEALRRVVSAPLLDPERLATLARFNLGAYDASLEAWAERRRDSTVP